MKKNVRKKIIIFHEGGLGGTPARKIPKKIINLIFECFPNRHIRDLKGKVAIARIKTNLNLTSLQYQTYYRFGEVSTNEALGWVVC